MMDEYISIAEFARLAGVSHQAVYKQLRNKLQPYLQVVEGKKTLSISALHDVFGIGVSQPIAQPNAQQVAGKYDSYSIAIAALEKQLEAKDAQLAEKDRQLAAKDEQIASLHRIMEQQNTLAAADKPTMFRLAGRDPGEGAPAVVGEDPGGGETRGPRKWYQFWR